MFEHVNTRHGMIRLVVWAAIFRGSPPTRRTETSHTRKRRVGDISEGGMTQERVTKN